MAEGPLRLLLIEDNPGDARLIREMLVEAADRTFRLEWADCLATGVTRLATERLAAIVLDLSLPDSEGLATFDTVHQQAPAVPIVVLTGLDDEDLGFNAVQRGAQDYLVKGQVDGLLLVRALRYAIERKRREEQDRFLSAASRILGASLDYAATIQHVARLSIPVLADCCVVDLLEAPERLRRVAVAAADPDREQRLRDAWPGLPFDHASSALAQRVLRTGHTEVYPPPAGRDPADSDGLDAQTDRLLAHFGCTAVLAVPLTARAGVMGVAAFATAEPGRTYGAEDRRLAEELGRRAALAIDNAQLYQQAQEAIRLRDMVLSSVTHDLRNPLGAIKMIVEAVKWQVSQLPPPDPAPVVEGMDRIDANISRMAAQIDELLDVARLQQGHPLTLHRRSTDLVQLAREQLADYQARTARHALRLETDETALTGRWDAARLERVVGNLLSNAIKYSLDGGEVVVRLRRDGTGQDVAAVLEVADHGAGIPAADRARVFTWFYRGENVADRVAGSGIGLAGARQIVELHGGTLTFTSEEGRGSTFTVRLPLQAVEAVQLV